MIVDLNFLDEKIFTFDPTLCFGEEVTINGNIYNQANPSGSEFLADASIDGCDSTVMVSLSFHPQNIENINSVLCDNESILVNGTTYNQSNPTGTEFMPKQ